MKFKLLNKDQQKTYAVILESGEAVMKCLTDFARQEKMHSAHFTAIGALSEATLGFFDFNIKDYKKIYVEEQVEVLSLIGDVSLYEGEPKVHAHIVLGKADGSAHGGHLLEGSVHPTLEIILTESPAHLKRELNEEIGIPLIQIESLNLNPVPK